MTNVIFSAEQKSIRNPINPVGCWNDQDCHLDSRSESNGDLQFHDYLSH